jgi:hypothetical protein
MCYRIQKNKVLILLETNQLYEQWKCRNPNLGLVTKARACKGVSQK